MKKNSLKAMLMLSFLLFLTLPSTARTTPTRTVDAAVQSGEGADVVLGPVVLELVNLNHLRYTIQVGVDVELTAGPDLSLVPFSPSLPTAPAVAPAAGSGTQDAQSLPEIQRINVQKIDQFVDGIQNTLSGQSGTIGLLRATASQSAKSLSERLNSVEALVRSSDQTLLADNGAKNLVSKIGKEIQNIDNDVSNHKWPAARDINASSAAVEQSIRQLDDLYLFQDFSTWIQDTSNFRRYQDLKSKAAGLRGALASIASGSDAQKGFAELVQKLRSWKGVLEDSKTEADFKKTIPVECGYPFFRNKTFEYKITRIDRTDPEKKSTEPLITVECPSNFSVSGGIGVSGIEERDYAFVTVPNADNSGVETRIDLENESSEQINPLFLINTRIGRLGESGAYGFHVSAGSVLDFDNPESDVRFGFVLGGSFSVKDNLFLTLGLQTLRISDLRAGIDTTKPIPPGLEEPPLFRKWETSWLFAVSYKLR